ncbi:cytochrome P450 716B1 [Brachypodium distachyon]|nr:cytochrome P450 716B1 [Brachypodium distachyon]|eukprot:XP_003561530.1 cytochrome P450 716B1 [Brachypodium distachyon]
MDASVLAPLVALFLASFFLVLRKHRSSPPDDRRHQQLPPGSFGLPVIGQTLSFLSALRGNTGEAWLRQWAAVYGPVSRFSFFGVRTALIVGPSANKFLFSSAGLTAKTTTAMNRMVGRRNIRELTGNNHRHVRAMFVQFLKLDVVRGYVGAIDDEVRHHLSANWHGHATIAVMPSMKTLTFDIMCTVIFGLDRGAHAAMRRDLSMEFQQLVRGVWSIPVNLPFTTFRKCLAASQRGRHTVAKIIDEKRRKLERGESSSSNDLMTHMLAEGMADDDIIDNIMFMILAAHDTTATLLTFLIRHLDSNKDAYAKVIAEQEEVARSKARGEALSWDDLGKMRYTWAAAMETLRMVPPIFGNFKRVVEDVEFNGHLIPKGWQVMTAMNLTQWDPAIFPDPGRFDPTRFESPLPPYSFVAFGGGGRVCPGNEFARVEALVAMHYIITGFRWKLADGCDGSFSRYPLPSPAQGLLIDIEPKDTTTSP